MKEIRWGFIGCGQVTEKKSGPAFARIEGSSVVAVMRRNTDLARNYALRHGIPKWYGDAQALVHDPDVNAIYIATPPSSHATYAIASLNAGKPVYVEKPMASTFADCQRMNEVSGSTGVPIFTAYYRRTLPYFQKVKDLLAENEIGEVRLINMKLYLPPRPEDYQRDDLPWRVVPAIAGAGYFYDLASHQLDLMDWLFGPAKVIHGSSFNLGGLYEAEDTVLAMMEYAGNIVACGSWSFIVPKESQCDRIEIIGTKGSISFSTFQFTPVTLDNQAGHAEYTPPNPENIQYYLIRSVVEELQGSGKCISRGDNGARVNRIMEEILGKQINLEYADCCR